MDFIGPPHCAVQHIDIPRDASRKKRSIPTQWRRFQALTMNAFRQILGNVKMVDTFNCGKANAVGVGRYRGAGAQSRRSFSGEIGLQIIALLIPGITQGQRATVNLR